MSCGKISKKTLNIREFLHLMSFCKEYLTQINFFTSFAQYYCARCRFVKTRVGGKAR